jgi:carnitine O-palmitoyltransferase 2
MLSRVHLIRGPGSVLTIQRSTSTTIYDSDSYQFLHKSTIPTYHFQKSLRRLPIPKLEQTCQRYLAAVQAVCSDSMIEEAKRTVEEFQKKEGPGRS